MSRWVGFAAAAVLSVAVVACGANGGDPVAGQQIPAGPADSPQPSDSASDQGASGGPDMGSSPSEQGGRSGSGDHSRTVGLPKSIRITEISPQDFENSIAAACGSKDGAPGCLTVTYEIVNDPNRPCGLTWKSDPPAVPTDEGGVSTVQRGSHIDATIVTCPDSGDTTSPAPGDTMAPAPDAGDMSTSDSPTASP